MLPFQKTTIYKETLTTVYEILQSLNRENAAPVIKKIGDHGLDLTAGVAGAFASNTGNGGSPRFEKALESIHSIIGLLDLGVQTKDISLSDRENIYKKLDGLKNDLNGFSRQQKKIMILSAELGQGHMSVSKAVKDAFEHEYGHDFAVDIYDFQEIISSLLNSFTKNTYESWVKFTPVLYKLLYEGTNTRIPLIKLLNQVNYPFVLNRLSKFFQEKNPDIIISTYPVWSYLACEIRKKAVKDAKFVSIITDSITVHNSWVLADNDYYLVANDDTAASLRKLGVIKEKIKVLGYPVRLEFMEKIDRDKFLLEQNLDPKKFTILFLPTSQQLRKNAKIIKSLSADEKYNIIIITGRDSKLKPKLEKYTDSPNIKIFGWTDKMSRFIKASDLVITKAGGSTVMECVAAGKPMIITSIIPGQETGNAELIKRHGLGLIAEPSRTDICENVEFIKKNYSAYAQNNARLGKPEAALNVASFLAGLIRHPST